MVAENVRCACAMNASKPPICPKCHKSTRLTLVKVKRIDCGPPSLAGQQVVMRTPVPPSKEMEQRHAATPF
jgi:hypothetical protein